MENITREQFMEFFRSEQFHNEITPDDALEIFSQVLHGSSELKEETFQNLLSEYSCEGLVRIYKPEEVTRYFLFGSELVDQYNDEGPESVDLSKFSGDAVAISHEEHRDIITQLLEAAIGWHKYIEITEEEFNQITKTRP